MAVPEVIVSSDVPIPSGIDEMDLGTPSLSHIDLYPSAMDIQNFHRKILKHALNYNFAYIEVYMTNPEGFRVFSNYYRTSIQKYQDFVWTDASTFKHPTWDKALREHHIVRCIIELGGEIDRVEVLPYFYH